jgi:hypothetical protein
MKNIKDIRIYFFIIYFSIKKYMEYIFYKLLLISILVIIILYYLNNVLNNTLNNKDFFTNKNKNDDIKIYVGITSIPIRLKYIHNTLNSLLNQDVKPDKIFVFLPEKSKRLKIDYNVDDIQKDKINDPDNIIQYVYGVSDEGPITKFYSLLDYVPKDKNNFLFIVDDDVIYPKSRIANIKKQIDINSKNSYGFSGRKYTNKDNKERLVFYGNNGDSIEEVDILEGFDMIAFPRTIFPDNSKEFLDWVKQLPEESFFVDDIILSKWCDLNNSKRFIYPKDENNKYYNEVDNVPENVKNIELLNENLYGRNLDIYKKLFLQ